jgi:hypothetical protein
MIPVREREHFVDAVKAKLVREVSELRPERSLIQPAQSEQRVNCSADGLQSPGARETYLIRLPHSITSSARARSVGGIVMPRALAVLRLMERSNLIGCWTGRSAGFAPFKIRST